MGREDTLVERDKENNGTWKVNAMKDEKAG